METRETPGAAAEGQSSFPEARAPRTQTLGTPTKTLDPPAAAVGEGGVEKESRVFELGFSSEIAPVGAPGYGSEVLGDAAEVPARGTLAEDSETSEHPDSVYVRKTPAVESRPYSSAADVEVVELGLLPNGSEENGTLGGGNWAAGEEEGDVGGGEGGGGGEVAVMGVGEIPFVVGDFVWGKIRSHPWWPGQVYDSSDASEYARKVQRKDCHCVLVAYFGDGTFAWSDPSQLKPFREAFEHMVRPSSPKNFAAAVKEALDEIGRCLESEMTCSCMPTETRARFSKPPAANAGIKEGVTVPEGRVGYMPSELLVRVQDIACDVSVANVLEVVVIRSWVSALRRGRGRCLRLPGCHQNGEIADLVDVEVKVSTDACLGGLLGEPAEEGWLSMPSTGTGVAKGLGFLEDKPSQRKKKRSMAELISEMDLGMEEEDDDGRDEEATVVPNQASPISRRKKKVVEKSPGVENGDAGGVEGTGSGRRERKKSKYLSPPYTMLSGFSKHTISPNDAETRRPKKDLEASQARDSGGKKGRSFPGSPPILKCNSEAIEDKKALMLEHDSASAVKLLSEFLSAALDPFYLKGNRSSPSVRGFFGQFRSSVYTEGSEYDRYKKDLDTVNDVEGKAIEGKAIEGKASGLEMNGSKDLHPETDGIKSTSSEPSTIVSREGKSVANEKKSPGHETDVAEGKSASGKKRRKSLVHDTNGPQEAKSGGRRKSFGHEIGGGSEEAKPGQKRKKKDKARSDNGAALLLTFVPGIVLPSKEDLVSTFSKFGVLCESETKLLKGSGCAQVVFAKSADAEMAFNSSDGSGAFGPGVANNRHRYLKGTLSPPPPPPPPPTLHKPPLDFVKKSLEQMISTLNESSPPGKDAGSTDGLKPEARENLVDEMNGLLKKVNKLLVGSATATSTT